MCYVCNGIASGDGACPNGVCLHRDLDCPGTKLLDYVNVQLTGTPVVDPFPPQGNGHGLAATDVTWPEVSG